MLSNFFGGLYAKLAIVASIVIGILVIFVKVFEAGKTQQNVQAMRTTLNAVKQRNKIDSSVATESIDDTVKRLQSNGWLDK